MNIAFDVDNVLADTTSTWCEKIKYLTGKEINKSNIKSHKIVGSVKMSPSYINQVLDQVWEDWESLPMTEIDLPKYIDKLKSNGYTISIVTCRPKRSKTFVKNWLRKNEINYDNLYFLGPYQSKSIMKVNYLVDDAPEHITNFVQTGKLGFIYDQPWNKKLNIENTVRVKSISEILSFFNIV